VNIANESFCPQRSAPLHEQVRDHFESRILSGSLPAGSKLPSTQDLAREHGTHVSTVHMALTELVQKGPLVRRKRHGTFVRERGQKLQNVAIYYPEDFWKVEEFAAKRVIHAALMNLLGEKDIKGSLWIDPRPSNLQKHKFAELEKAATDGLIDAVIAPLVDLEHLAWLRKLPDAGGLYHALPHRRRPGAHRADRDPVRRRPMHPETDQLSAGTKTSRNQQTHLNTFPDLTTDS